MKPIRVRENLFLGDAGTAKNILNYVEDGEWNVKAIVSVGGGNHKDSAPEDVVAYVHCGRKSVKQMSAAMLEANLFISEQHSLNQNVLVHCRGGMSRSPAVICCFLMYSEGLSWEEAVESI
eukprot:CAMPEP_0118715706 /NCGR_PEP_ID=MMETSP0800-20121206/27052_1 /TAXON_ID=210618 ORGANISM="Striatella unipunctata, Strain CCMP2910" /NCGR_SAMPLE_ID=MMETSP0800 /ASSEMBLY_ACC=CAM_ASM_000638 /LENGTH=120 /DNA_ID=CAMNT_0006621961 /DNA_START=173 /DNA_END=532 /DNA_ORIENTATION=-